jgi:hypothetical protein
VKKHPDLSSTHSAVLQLAQTLPYHTYQFSLFCDNLFSTPKLFSLLRQLGIGACGTARKNVTRPEFGSLDAWKVAWGTLHSKVVNAYPDNLQDGKVLMSIWQDSNKVGFCSTIHDGTEWIVRKRKKPKNSSTSATITKQPFAKFNPSNQCKELYKHTRLLPIPGITDDYNHYIGGVDIANQLRAGFSTQQRGFKPWRPLFYWLLDTAIINAFRIFEHQRKARLGLKKDKACSTHRAFQESLVLRLLKLPKPEAQQAYITQSTLLPCIQLTRPIEIHQFRQASMRAPCFFCR